MKALLIQNLAFLLLKNYICVPTKCKTKALQIPKSFHSWTSFSVQMLIGCLHLGGEKKTLKNLACIQAQESVKQTFSILWPQS